MPHQAGPLRRAPAGLQRDTRARLTRLEAANPGWRPLLAALRQTLAVLRELDPASFHLRGDASSALRNDGTPLLHGLVLEIDLGQVERFVRRLVPAAGVSGDELEGPRVLALLGAAMREDGAMLDSLAREIDRPAGALLVVGRYAAIPLLHGCAARLSGAIPPGWQPGYCPICGAWPVLAELRGLEQARRLRCGRCGADWAGEWLRCVFCGERDHARLGSLVPQFQGARLTAATCSGCNGYVKTMTTLVPMPVSDLLLSDLETVELDLAARDRGFVRPAGLGFPLEVSAAERLARPKSLWRR